MGEPSEDIDKIKFAEFQDEINKQRKVKFKIAKCPKVIYDKFKEFALDETGDLYPSALALLMERSKAVEWIIILYVIAWRVIRVYEEKQIQLAVN